MFTVENLGEHIGKNETFLYFHHPKITATNILLSFYFVFTKPWGFFFSCMTYRSGFETWLHPSKSPNFLCLSFVICKMGNSNRTDIDVCGDKTSGRCLDDSLADSAQEILKILFIAPHTKKEEDTSTKAMQIKDNKMSMQKTQFHSFFLMAE